MTMVSKSAVGTVTLLSAFICEVENSRPIENMRNTTPSWPIVWMLAASIKRLPPQVCSLRRIPAAIYPSTLGQFSLEKMALAKPATAIRIARSWKNALSVIWSCAA